MAEYIYLFIGGTYINLYWRKLVLSLMEEYYLFFKGENHRDGNHRDGNQALKILNKNTKDKIEESHIL